MKDIIKELNEYNVPIIIIDESLSDIKYQNRFSKKLEDANAFLEKAGIPEAFLSDFTSENKIEFEKIKEIYRTNGYSEEWIELRIKSITDKIATPQQ